MCHGWRRGYDTVVSGRDRRGCVVVGRIHSYGCRCERRLGSPTGDGARLDRRAGWGDRAQCGFGRYVRADGPVRHIRAERQPIGLARCGRGARCVGHRDCESARCAGQDRATTAVPNTGKVLSGGSVTLSSDAGYVVAQPGSRIDVSGASANFDQLQASGTYASQPVWSDAGSITLSAAYGLFADATLATRGRSAGRGGTLAILPHQNNGATGATALVIRQSGELTPAGLGWPELRDRHRHDDRLADRQADRRDSVLCRPP